jgi:hypothetical protein
MDDGSALVQRQSIHHSSERIGKIIKADPVGSTPGIITLRRVHTTPLQYTVLVVGLLSHLSSLWRNT